MQRQKIKSDKPFTLIANIRELEDKLVNMQMICKMHDSAKLTEQIRFLIALLDISRKYCLLGFTAKAARTYIRVAKIFSKIIE